MLATFELKGAAEQDGVSLVRAPFFVPAGVCVVHDDARCAEFTLEGVSNGVCRAVRQQHQITHFELDRFVGILEKQPATAVFDDVEHRDRVLREVQPPGCVQLRTAVHAAVQVQRIQNLGQRVHKLNPGMNRTINQETWIFSD
jgi:hypothetical protein